ncbi:pogo transposable element with ZNF domain isoform X2 [Salminus brasiliensis]|uniref:pogo transposable element with ZNF domain isoform X2 n=1 Tax=Salminus brasiliensis TaxID=930266 RepID=UPI003B83A037
MAESELYMQCEEEDFAACQGNIDETVDMADAGVSLVPSDAAAASTVQSPTTEDTIKTTVLPVAAAPVVPKQLLSSVLQPIQMAAGGTPGQPIYIASQLSPGAPQNLTTSIGYIVPTGTGQPVAFLSPAQASQIITSQLASPSGTPQPTSPENYTTVQIPVKLTICGPSGVHNIAAVASAGMPARGLSSSSLLPVSSPADSVQVTSPSPTAPPTAASEVVNSEVQSKEVVSSPRTEPNPTVPAEMPTQKAQSEGLALTVSVARPTHLAPLGVSTFTAAGTTSTASAAGPTLTAPVTTFRAPMAVTTRTVPVTASARTIHEAGSTLSGPSTVHTQASSQIPQRNLPLLAPKPQSPRSVTQVFQGASRPPQTCSVCGASYKAVPSLRGYLCRCNQKLVNSIQALSVQLRKKRAKRVSHRSPTGHSSFSTSAGGRRPSTSPSPPPPIYPPVSASVKHVTTSEIPEGAPSPGTGDYDQHGKLIILVEDFFYGKDPGQPVLIENNQAPIMMKCHLCDKKLKNNIKLMNHMKHHMEMERQSGDVDCHTECQHCFRNFSSPFTLQCHVETVHSQVECTALCKICELSFENEPLFLNHMKLIHKPGEMPYMCQVCNFRSSFYNDVVVHFRELHKDTNCLQCSYCLKVFKSSNGYQLHYSKHQKKTVQHCDKCRLQFLYSKEKAEHKALFHRTHLKPVQLMGLKPGTRVTIRAYSMKKVDNGSTLKAPSKSAHSPPLKEIPPSPAPSVAVPRCSGQKITPAKRKPVESMLELMTKFQNQCEPAKKQFCMECNYEIPDFSSHFPTFVHCSLCHYRTCCSRAYANHMISNHVSRKTTTKYLNLYKPCPKLGHLSCYSCDYTTEVGDSMAKHLAANPGHSSSYCKFSGFSRGYKRFVFIPTDLIRPDQRPDTRTLLPLHVIQVAQHSLSDPSKSGTPPNQCTNLPVSTAHTPSIPIQVQPVDQSTVPDENCGTQPKDSSPQKSGLSNSAHSRPEIAVGGSLTLAQLKMVLYALCFGVPQAANHFDTQPQEVQSLLLKRQNQLGPLKSREGLIPRASDRLAEWVLCQREQQLPINEGKLFSTASEIMSKDGGPGISHEWAVDFLLRHNLGLQALTTCSRLLPPKAQEHVHSFTRFMTKQVTLQNFAQSSIGAMDELSVFIDLEQLDPASADSFSMMSAFQLVGETDPLMDIVLTGLADGTMLPTMVFLNGAPLKPDAPSLPNVILLEAKPEGFTNEERLQLWFDKVWRQHVDPGSGGKGLLLMDTYRGHISDDFLASLNSANTLPGIVPRSCSCRLQPLEVCVGPVLREFLQARWSQHVMEAPQDLIGAEPADLALLLSTWIIEMLDILAAKPELLQRSFDQLLSSSPDLEPAEVSKLVRSLTETLIVSTIQEQDAEEAVEAGEKSNSSDITFPSPLPSPPANPQTLKKIFEKDSDLESFHGFEDSEITDC